MEDIEIFQGPRGLLAIGTVGRIRVGLENPLVCGPGLRILFFDGEVLTESQPVGRCRFVGRLHEGKFPLGRRSAEQGCSFAHSPSHLTGHRFDVFILPNRRLDAVGFKVGVERFGMILNQVGALLIRIMRARSQEQGDDESQQP